MEQHALTFIAKLKPDKAEPLEAYLRTIGHDINAKRDAHQAFMAQGLDLQLNEIKSLHFGRFALIPNDATNKKDYLIFSSNYDGDLDAHLNEFLTKFPQAARLIFGSCIGFPDTIDTTSTQGKHAFKQFIEAHAYRSEAFYTGYQGESVAQIKQYCETRRNFQRILDQYTVGDIPPKLRAIANESVWVQGDTDSRAQTPITMGKIILIIIDFIWHFLQIFIWRRLTVKHPNGAPLNLILEDDGRKIRENIKDIEDAVAQNQVTIISRIRPGLFTLFKVKVSLLLIQLAAKHIYNEGNLGGIGTIHFARWVIIDKGRYLLFNSNYDGTWVSYIGDFVDKGASGMDLIWDTAERYPTQGSRDIQKFKDIIRRNQIETQVFYSSVPDTTVKNILSDRRLFHVIKKHGGIDQFQ